MPDPEMSAASRGDECYAAWRNLTGLFVVGHRDASFFVSGSDAARCV